MTLKVTVIRAIQDSVIVIVGITGIADRIEVVVRLIGVGEQRAIITGIKHAVPVTVFIAGIALAVVIRISLVRVRDGLAVVDIVVRAVAVGVGWGSRSRPGDGLLKELIGLAGLDGIGVTIPSHIGGTKVDRATSTGVRAQRWLASEEVPTTTPQKSTCGAKGYSMQHPDTKKSLTPTVTERGDLYVCSPLFQKL